MCMRMHVHTRMCACVHTHAHVLTRVRARACACARACVRACVCVCACMYTWVRACMRSWRMQRAAGRDSRNVYGHVCRHVHTHGTRRHTSSHMGGNNPYETSGGFHRRAQARVRACALKVCIDMRMGMCKGRARRCDVQPQPGRQSDHAGRADLLRDKKKRGTSKIRVDMSADASAGVRTTWPCAQMPCADHII